MNIFVVRSPNAVPQSPSVLVLGNFDGVHAGHAHVFSELKSSSEAQSLLVGL